jgi:biopolymer transport protein ExbD
MVYSNICVIEPTRFGLHKEESAMPYVVKRKNHYAPRRGPVGDMNVTPFIDVLLVMLIMMILAIPIRPNVTEVDLPNGEPRTAPLTVLNDNTVSISPTDQLAWNGEPLSVNDLRLQVAAASAMKEPATIRFAPDAQASYDLSARTIALIKEEGADGFAFVGNHNYREFGS